MESTKLTSAQDAIKQAILEGHYGPNYWRTRFERDPQTEWKGAEYEEIFSFEAHNRILIDPLFWQALGKARGWNIYRGDSETLNTVTFENDADWKKYALRWMMNRLSNDDEQFFWLSLP